MTVAARHGHDPATMFRVYAHVIKGRDAAAALVGENLLDQTEDAMDETAKVPA